MSNEGLSIFDHESEGGSAPDSAGDKTQVLPVVDSSSTSAPPSAPLPVVRRGGYDMSAVNERIKQLTEHQRTSASALSTAKQRITELESQVDKLKSELAENKDPSYAGLGGRASAMLRLAEEEADDVKSAAENQAAEILAQAERDAKAVRADAEREVTEIHGSRQKEIEDRTERLIAEAEQERKLAQADAEEVRAAAQRAADQITIAVEQEVAELRTSVQREVEQARAGADREVQEARRMLAVEKERLAKEASDHHDTALAETNRLVTEAEDRAKAAEERAASVREKIAEQRTSVQAEADALLSRAKREAEQLVSNAKAKAEAAATSGAAEAEHKLAAVRAEVDRMTKRRDAISAQLASLSELVSGFSHDDTDEDSSSA